MTFLDLKEGPRKRNIKERMTKTCNTKTLKKRLPILQWLPNYTTKILIQDSIAGLTVGLTVIAQGIAYAIVAGLPPEQGLYAALTAGVIYAIFGSCYFMTVGPTAIMSAMTAKYVSNYSPEFAILAGFLTGIIITAMGVLNLGFIVDFISMPVISGFSMAAALQVSTSQLKNMFGIEGSSGDYFAESVYNFYQNIGTMSSIWEPVFGFSSIVILLLLKRIGDGCKQGEGFVNQLRWYISLSRNAVVIILGMIVVYVIKVTWDVEPINLIGDIKKGLPTFGLPAFSAVVGNVTYSFTDMMSILGPQSIALSMVSIMESVAIGKAFSNGASMDTKQELFALGLCNIAGGLGQGMPLACSFSRTALNYCSGVKTPASGIVTTLLVLVSLTLLTSIFYYIPKAALAGLIITAMFTTVFDLTNLKRLWKNSKQELFVLLTTMTVCLSKGLEYGIMSGIIIDTAMLLYRVARPAVDVSVTKCEKVDIMVVPLSDGMSYCSAEFLRRTVLKAYSQTTSETLIIIDGTSLRKMDLTVASNLMCVVRDLQNNSQQVILMNFNSQLKGICLDIDPSSENKFYNASNPIELSNHLMKDV